MKLIKYMLLQSRINHGTEEVPNYEDIVLPKEIHCTTDELEVVEEIAKKEAYNGEYTIEDDGQPEPEVPVEEDDVWDELALALQEGVDSI